ncbi:MAG TPA: hypothetical protein DC049_08320, partial [Spirochaetia bacterium]|nr:hypothetical protein [Spirochaetia bacterium]
DLYAVRDLRSPWGKEDCRGRLNFSFSDLLAAMALSELSLAEKFISRRREIGACYTSAVLRGKNHHLAPDENMQINFYCYPVLFASPVPEVISLFKKYKIEVRRPLPLPVYTLLKLPDEDFPLARNIWMKLAAVPIYPSLLKTEVETVSRLLQRIK